MRDGWREVPLRELLSLQRRPAAIAPTRTYKLVTLAVKGRGARLRSEVSGADLGTAKNIVRAGDLMISKIDARKGPNPLLPSGLDGAVVTGDFLSYEVDCSLVLPAYMDLWVRRPAFADMCDTVSGGTTNRVRLDTKRFLNLSIPLPSIEEQERIVDLVGSLDDAVAAAEGLCESVKCLYSACRKRLQPVDAPAVPLSKLVSVARAGGTPSRKGEGFFGGTIPWVKSGEVAGDAIRATDEQITERALTKSSAWLVPAGAVLVAMYGATAGQVGRLEIPAATNQAVLALVADPAVVNTDYLYHLLRSDGTRLKSLATGAAQPNLSKGVLVAQEYRVPDLALQAVLGLEMSAALAVQDAAASAADRLRDLRSNLLAALLSGAHEIPDSYDELLAG